MGRHTTRFVSALIGLSVVLGLPPRPATMAADKLPLSGSLEVTTVGATINIDLAYRANAPITRFAVSLTGPSFDGVLFETVDAHDEVTWSGSADDLVAGTYTVTVSAEIQRNGNRTSGSTVRSIEVGGVPALPKPVSAGAGEPVVAAEAAPPLPGDVVADIVIYGATPSGVIAAVSAARRGPASCWSSPAARGRHDEQRPHRYRLRPHGHDRRSHTRVLRPHAGGGGLGLRALPIPALDRRSGLRGDAGRLPASRSSPGDQLAESGGVTKSGTRIAVASALLGSEPSAKVFVDASYEGDLMAGPASPTASGGRRLANRASRLAGVEAPRRGLYGAAGLDPAVPLAAPGALGTGDNRIQYSNFRLCFSTSASNQGPVHGARRLRPGDLRPPRRPTSRRAWRRATRRHDLVPLAGRAAEQQVRRQQQRPGVDRRDGPNWATRTAATPSAADMDAWLRGYTQASSTSSQRPAGADDDPHQMAAYGLCKDEFVDNGNWPAPLPSRGTPNGRGQRSDAARRPG